MGDLINIAGDNFYVIAYTVTYMCLLEESNILNFVPESCAVQKLITIFIFTMCFFLQIMILKLGGTRG